MRIWKRAVFYHTPCIAFINNAIVTAFVAIKFQLHATSIQFLSNKHFISSIRAVYVRVLYCAVTKISGKTTAAC